MFTQDFISGSSEILTHRHSQQTTSASFEYLDIDIDRATASQAPDWPNVALQCGRGGVKVFTSVCIHACKCVCTMPSCIAEEKWGYEDCNYISIYINVYIYACMYACMYVHICVYVCVCMYMCMNGCLYFIVDFTTTPCKLRNGTTIMQSLYGPSPPFISSTNKPPSYIYHCRHHTYCGHIIYMQRRTSFQPITTTPNLVLLNAHATYMLCL